MKLTRKSLACAVILAAVTHHACAGIPVIDAGNLSQNILSATEEIAQTLKQIQQYKTQLDQYQLQIQNSAAPAAYVWDQAQRTMTDLVHAMDTLSIYKRRLGSLNAYLAKFGDTNHYLSSPCYSPAGCSPAQRADLRQREKLGSEARKSANDALMKSIDSQQVALTNDAIQLERLQRGVQSASGRMQALQFANQIASEQAHQLLQMRGLLVAQQNAYATQMQAAADSEARADAAHEKSTVSRIKATPSPRNWLLIRP